jgi:predicted DNA-binding transcriptional regulator AlpA
MRKKITDNQVQPAAHEPRLLTERQVATLTGIGLSTLRHWRTRRTGPPFLKLGRKRQSAVRYALRDVVAWAEGFRVETRPLDGPPEARHGRR